MTLNLKTFLMAASLTLLLDSGGAMAVEVQGQEVSVTAPEVQQYLEAAFPQDHEVLGGLFTLTARDPELTIPATGQRLQMTVFADASSPGRASAPVARITMSSALRYDPVAYAVYLDQPTIDDVQPAAPGHRVDEQTRMLLNLWLADYADDEPLYQLEPAMVRMLGTLNAESTRIEDQRIVIRFNQAIGDLPASLE